MDLDREIGYALDALADAEDHNRVACLLDVAERFEEAGETVGNPDPLADRVPALVYRMVADADLVATGQLSRRHAVDYPFNSVAGDVFDRMAAEPDLRQRAAMVAELARLVDVAYRNDSATESVAMMPYGGLVGGRDELYMPRSFPKLVRNVYRRWRETRAA